MNFFSFRSFRKKRAAEYDRSAFVPVIRSSICTGEKTAGFKNRVTGKFQEVMLIRSAADMKAFLCEYGLKAEELRTEY